MKPGQQHKAEVPEGEVLHLSQVCLHSPKAGTNWLQVVVGGTTYSACCLEKDKTEHASLDLFFGQDAPTFVNKGASEIHMSGYLEPMDEDEEESEEEDEEAEKPAAKAAAKAAAKSEASPKASPKAAAKAAAKAEAAAEEEDDEEDDEDEEGEEEEPVEASAEEDEASASKKKAALAALAKRKAGEPAAPPAKKAKGEPATEAKPVPAKDAEYIKQLVDFIKANGKQKISDLGTKVKRPPGVPKMSVIFANNKDKFVVTGETVALK